MRRPSIMTTISHVESLAIFRELTRDFPGITDYDDGLAVTRVNLAKDDRKCSGACGFRATTPNVV